jgi:NADPH:quinone reductase-like Zn-dependent oxidoreductase
MKAAFRTRYGSPEVLSIRELDKPSVRAGEVLVRVGAATVNRTDCAILWAKPFVIRFFAGLRKPRLPTTGTDFAGVVEAAGPEVAGLKAGDRVWGFHDEGLSSHAEYLAIPERKPVLKIPDGVSFEQAAASGEAAHYAYNFINRLELRPGMRILVNGGTGAIGSAAVQLLNHLGARVTATCRGEHAEVVKGLGAERVIDYTREDFTRDEASYDVVVDAVGKSTFFRCRRVLNPGGTYVSSEFGPYVQNVYLPLLTKWGGGRRVVFPIPFNIRASLEFINRLSEAGKFKPLIDKRFPLEKIREAFAYVASGQKVGNVLVTPS